MTTMNVNIINTALVGSLLSPVPWLATLGLSLQFVTSMLTTLPASLLMVKFGRGQYSWLRLIAGGQLLPKALQFYL